MGVTFDNLVLETKAGFSRPDPEERRVSKGWKTERESIGFAQPESSPAIWRGAGLWRSATNRAEAP